MPTHTLAQANIGETYVVSSLGFDGAMKMRLTELGFTEGAEVLCVLISAHGDMSCFLVRGACIAMRKRDLAQIAVK